MPVLLKERKGSTSLITGQMQINIIVINHFTPVRMAITKKKKTRDKNAGVEKNVNECSHCGKQYGDTSKN